MATRAAKTARSGTRAAPDRRAAATPAAAPAPASAPATASPLPKVLPSLTKGLPSLPPLQSLPGAGPLLAAARQVRALADGVLSMAGPAADMAIGIAKSQVKHPTGKAAFERVGSMLRKMRETAGMSAAEVAHALDLTDPALIEQAEVGKIALPFEMLLRLAAVLGRNDPITALMRLTRAYSPELWKSLESLGVGRLVVQAGRERELANLFRANDSARKLNDADFVQVLEFTKQAFDMAVEFRVQGGK